MWTVADRDYMHTFEPHFLSQFLINWPLSQVNNLMELWRTIRTKVKTLDMREVCVVVKIGLNVPQAFLIKISVQKKVYIF